MKDNNVYSILIYYFIFVAIKKTYDLFMEYKYPTFEDMEKANASNSFLLKLRDSLAVSSVSWGLYIIFNYKTNNYILVILSILILTNFMYFLIERRFIYYFVDKKNLNMDVVMFVDSIINNVCNLMVALYAFYVVLKIYSTN